MSRALRSLAVLLVLCSTALPPSAAQDMALERGTAITDPLSLRALDRGRFGIARMLAPERSATAPLSDAELFSLPSMAPVRQAIDAEFDRYVERHRVAFPHESIGVGDDFAVQLFDRARIYSPDTRFMLAGIVNRMDRGYLSDDDCGEIRLIYRLIRTDPVPAGEGAVSPRLPMTLNLVLRARRKDAADHDGQAVSCAGIARRWLATSAVTMTGSELAERLSGDNGPLALIDDRNVERIETNIQIAFAPKSASRDFRTDYLLKVFDYDAQAQRFEEAPLENQIDRDRILADGRLRRDFKNWLLAPAQLREFDRGTILVPQRFLARAALAPTPAGLAPSDLQPEFGLLQGEGSEDPALSEADIVAALKHAAEQGVTMQNIRSLAGFQRRLNDITCAGCHQTRGIGGFHFPGVDWTAEKPSNATIVPASPHFFGDQIRRRDILTAFAEGRRPDFSRGFADRPQVRGSTELAGTEYQDGWGARCYLQGSGSTASDASFTSWTCAKGLACQVAGTSRIGMCFVQTR